MCVCVGGGEGVVGAHMRSNVASHNGLIFSAQKNPVCITECEEVECHCDQHEKSLICPMIWGQKSLECSIHADHNGANPSFISDSQSKIA